MGQLPGGEGGEGEAAWCRRRRQAQPPPPVQPARAHDGRCSRPGLPSCASLNLTIGLCGFERSASPFGCTCAIVTLPERPRFSAHRQSRNVRRPLPCILAALPKLVRLNEAWRRLFWKASARLCFKWCVSGGCFGGGQQGCLQMEVIWFEKLGRMIGPGGVGCTVAGGR